MNGLTRSPWTVASALLVPWLVLAAPTPLSLAGVPPSWAVLWLLPWSLVDGPRSGLMAGIGLALLLDGLHAGPLSQVPALALLGWWWGRLGRSGPVIERSFNLGLLAVLGTALVGGSLWIQQLGWGQASLGSLHTLLAQSLLTGLLAPMVCSLQVLLWRQVAPGARS